MMRNLLILLAAMLILVACENPIEPTIGDENLNKTQTLEVEKAPFLLDANSLAKKTQGYVIIDPAVSAGTVYGSKKNSKVYTAVGGEILPRGTWVGNLNDEPVQVELSAKLTISFANASTVTVLGAENLKYINADGDEILFSGDGVITAVKIFTAKKNSTNLGKTSGQESETTTLITDIDFGIGGDGGEE